MRVNEQTVYLTDNGAAYCGAHLGATARATGRDISGQRILAVSAEMAADAIGQGFGIECEKCGKKAALIVEGK